MLRCRSVEGALKEVKRAMIDADVNLRVTNQLVEVVKAKAIGAKLAKGEILEFLHYICSWWLVPERCLELSTTRVPHRIYTSSRVALWFQGRLQEQIRTR